MKRIILALVLMMFVLGGCSTPILGDLGETLELKGLNDQKPSADIEKTQERFLGTWFTYLEIKPQSFNIKKEDYEKQLEKTFANLSEAKVTDVFVQVRPFADAIYPSAFFPSSSYVVKNQGDELPFDFFEVIIEKAKKHSMKVHAWINPFRVQMKFDKSKLGDASPAKRMLDEKSSDIVKANKGLYFDPASEKVKKLIINGVRELLETYDISGIHIDDYFYPTKDASFDKASYEAYKKEGGTLSLEDFRRENINLLVSMICETVHSFGKDKVFSISPCGDIEKNKNEYFADVEKWCGEKGYCDIIIPQLYYGFENEKMPFELCAKKWKALVCCDVKLCAGLALYKAGKEDAFAGKSGKEEWLRNDNIIKRQAELLKSLGYDGFCLYSSQYVKFIEISSAKEMQNLQNVL